MKTSFSRSFFAAAIVLLSALLLVGASFQILVRNMITKQSVDELENYCETICDGRHLVPGSVRMYAKCKGLDRIVAITDSIMAAGLPDGNYHLGVNDVVVIDGDAKLASNGTRAGSTLTQDVALKNMLKWLPNTLEEILPTLSENPAKEMNLWDRKGSIETGKDADLVLLDEEANIVHVFARGKQVK